MTYDVKFVLWTWHFVDIYFAFSTTKMSLKVTGKLLAENRRIVDQLKEDESFQLLIVILKTVTTTDTRMQKKKKKKKKLMS